MSRTRHLLPISPVPRSSRIKIKLHKLDVSKPSGLCFSAWPNILFPTPAKNTGRLGAKKHNVNSGTFNMCHRKLLILQNVQNGKLEPKI